MLIAHISDTHIPEPGAKVFGVAPMAENLTRCVHHINSAKIKPDLVLLSGDITNNFSAKAARHTAEILSELTCPYYIVPGNHDDRDVLWDVFAGNACPSRPEGFLNFVIETDELRLIGFDTLHVGEAGGMMCAARGAWLSDTLAQNEVKPTLIFMHHPPLNLGVRETDLDGFIGAAALGDIIERRPNIERILCGHIHLVTHSRWRGTVVSTAPSMGMQLHLDLMQSEPSMFVCSDPAYLLHHWTPEKVLVSHVILLTDEPGPYLFEQA